MKYMGSKSLLLRTGLREILDESLVEADLFVDLFSGSASVAVDVATRWDTPVVAVDVQEYARVFASAMLSQSSLEEEVLQGWLKAGRENFAPRKVELQSSEQVHEARAASASSGRGFVEQFYGGHYFSPYQAATFDNLLQAIPVAVETQDVYLAAILATASDAAAAPGHTAQPFQPTVTALQHIRTAWNVDPLTRVERYVREFSSFRVKRAGTALRSDAFSFLSGQDLSGALVFCDPPYSEVQYSRFYHVLEGLARGGWPSVSGAGRAPALSSRYSSEFSSKKNSSHAFRELFRSIAGAGANAIVTFPNHDCSNGQSAASLMALAAEFFEVEDHLLDGRHSSLGATSASSGSRVAHRDVSEAVLVMRRR